MIQLSHTYLTPGKNKALTRWTIVGKVMSMFINKPSRFIITFLPTTKHLLISWLQSPSTVILEPRKIKSDTASIVSPSISHEMMGPDAIILVSCMLSFKPTFSLLFHFHQEALQFLFTFCHNIGVVYISEVIDISLGNLDSIPGFIQPRFSHDVLCI